MPIPRGIRNYNPLNIRHGMSHWQGMADAQADRQFVTFKSYAYGYRAAWKILDSYYLRFRQNQEPFCLQSIVERWAPADDGNDVNAYLRAMLRHAPIAEQERLPRPCTAEGYEKLKPVLVGMTCVECGIKPEQVKLIQIEKGFRLAFPKVVLE